MTERRQALLDRIAGDGPAVLLDGGLSNALLARGADLSGDLWTARLLAEDPDLVAAVHRAYFEAGAEVATTATYQADVETFVAAGLGRAEAEGLIRRGVELAREVRDEMSAADGRDRWVAASLGPYGALLADGSEYTGRYGVGADRLRDVHGPRLELLASAGPDVIAVETVPDVQEAAVVVSLLEELDVPAWISFSIDGDRTRAGQPLAEAFAVAASSRAVVATGVNCCSPEDVEAAVRAIADAGLPAVAYPNSGEGWDSGTHTWSGDACFDVALVPGWVRAGARLVGGCCQVGPDDVRAMAPLR